MKDPYPVPVIQPTKWNYQEYCGPSILTCDYEDTEQCNVQRNGNPHNEGNEDINIGLIS